MACELSVIIPTRGRPAKLRTLLEGIARTASDHHAFEIIVVVDGPERAPLEAGSVLPRSIRFVGLTKDHAGPAAARNHAIREARGRWLLFYDDDARVDGGTIPNHLRLIRSDPTVPLAHLGRADWPSERIDSPWHVLLAQTSMLFFWDRMRGEQSYGFRHFWTINLSVRADCVRQVGGFREAFPHAMHEDIELGWRLENRFGLKVRVDDSLCGLHDHPLTPCDYFLREHRSGWSAHAARSINGHFHDAVWPWIADGATTLATLERLFLSPARAIARRLAAWAEPSPHRPSRDELEAMHYAHLPLKRMAFLHGYLGRPFERFWDRMGAER